MSYLVFARKYRPQDFDSISGQEHITRTLRNAIEREKVAHAFLFCGPRGVGKTSVARVLAKALNCDDGPTPSPCSSCTNCKEITTGKSLAVLEIDGASHNSVDNVRELIDTLKSCPPPGSRSKVYIIDEVHMLSIQAFNALLKSLEEPPPRTIFILATTEVHKIPETIISRCQRYDFRAMSTNVIVERLREITDAEGYGIELAVLRLIARLADGSMRDAQSLLDRVCAFGDTSISSKDVSEVLGIVERGTLFELSAAIVNRDCERSLVVLADAFSTGIDPRLFAKEFVTHWRDLLLARVGGSGGLERLGIMDDDAVELQRQSESLSAADLQDLFAIAEEGADRATRTAYARYALEALVVRMATREPVIELAKVVAALQSGKLTEKPVAAKRDISSDGVSKRGVSERTVSESSASKAETTSSTPTAKKPPTAAGGHTARPAKRASPLSDVSMDWRKFVTFVSDRGEHLLSEQLKRISVEKFETGVLEGCGPVFCVNFFAQLERRKKLAELLAEYSKVGDADSWRVGISESTAGGRESPGSLADEDSKARAATEDDIKRDIAGHPVVENLKKAFPGSRLESITVKEPNS